MFYLVLAYAGEVEDIITTRLAISSEIIVPKIRAFSFGLMTLC